MAVGTTVGTPVVTVVGTTMGAVVEIVVGLGVGVPCHVFIGPGLDAERSALMKICRSVIEQRGRKVWHGPKIS